MRELKFRAWDKVEKKMLFDADPFAIHVSGSNEPLLAETHRNEDCIFEQYTGLKDKNGKEIYEGDIMMFDACLYKVVWNKKYAGFDYATIGERGVTSSNAFRLGKVIGNIHENPELLEKNE